MPALNCWKFWKTSYNLLLRSRESGNNSWLKLCYLLLKLFWNIWTWKNTGPRSKHNQQSDILDGYKFSISTKVATFWRKRKKTRLAISKIIWAQIVEINMINNTKNPKSQLSPPFFCPSKQLRFFTWLYN